MEFHVKLQQLRKQKGLTQEELAESLFVSRTAVSKWESGRGYPNIDSLKAIARFFSVTIDELLSGEEALTIGEESQKEQVSHLRDLVLGLLDCSTAMFLFLPFFGQTVNSVVQTVSLLGLTEIASYLKVAYFASVTGMVALGILTLALQDWDNPIWMRCKSICSLGLGGMSALLFIISTQPYAAAFSFLFLMVKVFLLVKKP